MIPARDLKKGYQVKEKILEENPGADIILLEIDLCSFSSIQRFCFQFLSLNLPLNILMSVPFPCVTSLLIIFRQLLTNIGELGNRNNAGKFANKMELSEEKVEMTFATNYLGMYKLPTGLILHFLMLLL